MNYDHGIVFDGVWKKFHRGELHDSLRDLIPAVARRITGRRRPNDELQEGDFWAVRDVSFDVGPGEALGIIGPNGAGKSTVLKLISRILRPTRGSCELKGRMGALIEIAAGFHPDLTGRENVFLQGAIMGMSRAEIRDKFDEIVDFSGISEFIDTQVKRYSSGMNARLGFAIAAHLNPDVLLVDEVLAVGDMNFQTKAYGRIRELTQQDLAVVVVSHQLDKIASLCTKAIVLDRGEVVYRGPARDAVAAYTSGAYREDAAPDTDAPIRIDAVRPADDRPVYSGEYARVRISGRVLHSGAHEELSLAVRCLSTQTGSILYTTTNRGCDAPLPTDAGPFELELELQMNLPPGLYALESSLWDNKRQKTVGNGPSAHVQVEGPRFYGEVQMNPRMRLVESSGSAADSAVRSGASLGSSTDG
ncbi:MAG: ABC transporter ATP-binding protein [Gemmatimonadales bacterium]|jgi:ABC-type polysaccharide/polyol phosphate transport system ATPase subunit